MALKGDVPVYPRPAGRRSRRLREKVFHRRDFVRPKHHNIENALYFITTHCAEGVKPFRGGAACDAFITVLGQKQTVLGFGLYAYVLMPNHYHMILQLPEEVTIWKLMNYINGASSRAVNDVVKKKYSHVWQGGFHDVVIRTAQEFAVKVNYVHNNPVAWKLVQKPEEYPYSSSQFYLKHFGSPSLVTQGFDDFALMGMLNSVRTVLDRRPEGRRTVRSKFLTFH